MQTRSQKRVAPLVAEATKAGPKRRAPVTKNKPSPQPEAEAKPKAAAKRPSRSSKEEPWAPADGHTRCRWCFMCPANGVEEYVNYHDTEWGRPVHDDTRLFEFLILEGAQAGLSWITVLKRREEYRQAFKDFDMKKVAAFTEKDMEALMEPTGPRIVRNRAKIKSAVHNARAAVKIVEEYGSLSSYLWGFVPGGKPIQNTFKTLSDVPAKTPESERMSKELKKRGMNFVGPTICYAYMQSMGMVMDHTVDCFLHEECKSLSSGPE